MPVLIPTGTDTTVEWLDWAARLQLHLKECPTILIADEIKEQAIKFYRDSRAWRATGVTLATTVAAQAAYTVSGLPTNAALAGLPAVWADDLEVSEAVDGQGDDYLPDETGEVDLVGVTGESAITVYPLPVSAGVVITGTVAYRPSDASTGLPSSLYMKHRDAIESMTLARMMMMPGKPWTDPKLALFHAQEGRARALHDSTKAGPRRRNQLRVTPSPL